MAQIHSLYVYPVKSLQGMQLSQSRLEVTGLRWDRQWMLIDGNGKFLSQRQLAQMATISVELSEDLLHLSHPSMTEGLRIPLHPEFPGEQVEVSIWEEQCQAFDEGKQASNWLTKVLGQVDDAKLRLVRFDNDFQRAVNGDYLNEGENSHTAFSDGFPYLICNLASLEELNRKLSAENLPPIDMPRFRPNIVLEDLLPFEEEHVESIEHESFRLDLRKPCVRCHIISIDQQRGISKNSRELHQSLMHINPKENLPGSYFGQNAILAQGQGNSIRVGDQVRLS